MKTDLCVLRILYLLAYLILKKYGRVKLSWWNRQSVQNQVTRRMSDISKLSLVAGSWLFHDDDNDDANLWQLGLFTKIGRCVSRFITIVKGVYVCNDNVPMFPPLAPIKIFRLTRRDACAISAHNQVCCRSSPVYTGAPGRQNQVCYMGPTLIICNRSLHLADWYKLFPQHTNYRY